MILDQLSIILQSLSSSSKETTPTICMDSFQAEPLVLMEEEASFTFPTIKSTIPMNSFQIDAIDQNEYYITPRNRRKSQLSTYRSKNKSKSKPESKSLIITKNRPKRKAYLEAMQWIRCDMKIFNNQKTSYASPIRRHPKKKLIRQQPVLSSVTEVVPCENEVEQCVASNTSMNNTIMLVRSVTKTNQQFDALVLSTTKSITNTKKMETLPTQIEEDCSTNQMIKHKFGKNTNMYSSYSNNSFYLWLCVCCLFFNHSFIFKTTHLFCSNRWLHFQCFKTTFFCSISIIHTLFISITISDAILLYSSTKSTFINFFCDYFDIPRKIFKRIIKVLCWFSISLLCLLIQMSSLPSLPQASVMKVVKKNLPENVSV